MMRKSQGKCDKEKSDERRLKMFLGLTQEIREIREEYELPKARIELYSAIFLVATGVYNDSIGQIIGNPNSLPVEPKNR